MTELIVAINAITMALAGLIFMLLAILIVLFAIYLKMSRILK